MQDIPGHATWRSIEAQTQGWSSDRIFHIVDEQGQHLLLRTNDSSQYVNKRDEFQWTQHLAAKGIAMSQPLDFGLFDSGRQVYSLLSWIEGKDGAQWVAEQPAAACYELGLQAGQILQQIHSVAAPEGTENAEQQMRAIYRKKLEQYRSCGHKVAHEQDFLQFLEQHFHLLADTPLAKIDDIEFVRTIAVARITMPMSMVRLSAGRESMSEATQALCFMAGANSIFTGDKLLTAANAGDDKDAAMLAKLGLVPMEAEEPLRTRSVLKNTSHSELTKA